MSEFTAGSGNVYADLGHPDPAAALAKAEECSRLGDALAAAGLSEAAAAATLGLPASRLARLLRGDFGALTAAAIAAIADRAEALSRTA